MARSQRMCLEKAILNSHRLCRPAMTGSLSVSSKKTRKDTPKERSSLNWRDVIGARNASGNQESAKCDEKLTAAYNNHQRIMQRALNEATQVAIEHIA
jgi:hypothetical protein